MKRIQTVGDLASHINEALSDTFYLEPVSKLTINKIKKAAMDLYQKLYNEYFTSTEKQRLGLIRPVFMEIEISFHVGKIFVSFLDKRTTDSL